MFASGSSQLKDYTETILREVAKVINKSPNHISISGHTDQTPFVSSNGYSNWELSADRANAARRALVNAGLQVEKVSRVVGLSDSVLFDKKNPFNPINRRISIVVMNKATEKSLSTGEASKAPKATKPKPASTTEKKKKPVAETTKKNNKKKPSVEADDLEG